MKILVTGGAGFIGSELCLKLISEGHEVRVLDNLSSQIHGEDPRENSELFLKIKGKVDFVYGDICDRETLEFALKGIEGIYHLAAETGTGQSMYEIERYSKVNVNATAVLLELIASKTRGSIKRVVLSSTRAIYGEGRYNCHIHGVVYPKARKVADVTNGNFECNCPFCEEPLELIETTEDSMVKANSVYGVTKFAQEALMSSSLNALGTEFVALRYQNVYGPGQSLKNPYTGILSIFSTRFRNNNNIVVFEDGLESRDFVFIDDVVEASYRAMFIENLKNEVINVGMGQSVTVISIAKTMKAFFKNSNSKIECNGKYRIGDIRHNLASIKKLESLLNYKPKVPFAQGIKSFLEWVETQEVPEDRFESSITELQVKGLYK